MKMKLKRYSTNLPLLQTKLRDMQIVVQLAEGEAETVQKAQLLCTLEASISEMLEEYLMTQKELATRMEITEENVSALIKGKSPINQKHAKKLELILGLPASFWMNLQRNYEKKHDEEGNVLSNTRFYNPNDML